jgi:hypothetical protein
MQRLVLSAGARVYSENANGKITDSLFWDLLVAVSNEDGTPVTLPLQQQMLEFTVFALIAGEDGAETVIRVPTQVEYPESSSYGFYHLSFAQQNFPQGGVNLIPKVIGVQASIVPVLEVGRNPKHVPIEPFAQGRTVCGVTGEPGYYGLDIVPPANAQFFFGCVKNNS